LLRKLSDDKITNSGYDHRLIMSKLLDRYASAMDTHPYLTNVVTGCALAGLGDYLCQTMIEKRGRPSSSISTGQPLDARRVITMALIRGLLVVPFLLWWYGVLNHYFPGTSNGIRAKKTLLNEIVGAPGVISLVFFGNALSALLIGSESGDRSNPFVKMVNRFRSDFFPAWKKSPTYWPFVHFLGTYRLPIKFQAPFAHIASIYWNMVLSYYASREIDIDLHKRRK